MTRVFLSFLSWFLSLLSPSSPDCPDSFHLSRLTWASLSRLLLVYKSCVLPVVFELVVNAHVGPCKWFSFGFTGVSGTGSTHDSEVVLVPDQSPGLSLTVLVKVPSSY